MRVWATVQYKNGSEYTQSKMIPKNAPKDQWFKYFKLEAQEMSDECEVFYRYADSASSDSDA